MSERLSIYRNETFFGHSKIAKLDYFFVDGERNKLEFGFLSNLWILDSKKNEKKIIGSIKVWTMATVIPID